MHSVLEYVGRDASYLTDLRRDIHRHPELSFQEARTSDLVARLLTEWGYGVHRGLGGTGVVGQLKVGTSRRVIGIRADMDALPITETSGLPHASVNDGVMHACGHDGHTAMLLGAAKAIAERKNFDGTVNLIFQPAEEWGRSDSGAARMIRDGLFERFPCDSIFCIHNMPGIPEGRLVFRNGPMMASSDDAVIVVRGQGGHAALPHLARDPVVAASSIVMALQSVVSRNVAPIGTAVVTVGIIRGGTARNIIPASVELELSIRALDRKVRDLLQERITAISTAQAESYGCTAEITYNRSYPPLVNTSAETEMARAVGLELVGAAGIDPHGDPLTGSEDFSYMLEAVPGSYLLIGNGCDGAAGACQLHRSGYDFNDANLPLGAAYWTLLTERCLAPSE